MELLDLVIPAAIHIRPSPLAITVLARLLLLFTILPLVELALLLYLADQTSWEVAVGWVLATGIAGAMLMKLQGIAVLRRIREQVRRGETPTDALLDGLMILAAGCLLITPGMITDVLGFLLLFPPLRAVIRKRVRDRVSSNFRQGMSGGWTMSRSSSSDQENQHNESTATDRIIDARVVEEASAEEESQAESEERNSQD